MICSMRANEFGCGGTQPPRVKFIAGGLLSCLSTVPIHQVRHWSSQSKRAAGWDLTQRDDAREHGVA